VHRIGGQALQQQRFRFIFGDHRARLGLFTHHRQIELLQHLRRVHHQLGALLDELVGSVTAASENIARHSKNVAPLLDREIGCDQSPTAQACLDHHGSQAQAADNPITRWEIAGIWLSAQCVFAHHGPVFCDLLGQTGILLGVDDVDPAAQHGDRPAAGLQATAVGDGVDAPGHSADDGDPGPGHVSTQHARGFLAIDRCPPGADDGHGPLVAGLNAPAHIQDRRRIVDLAQVRWVVGAVPGEDVGPQPLDLPDLSIQVQFLPCLEQVGHRSPVEAGLLQIVSGRLPGSPQVAKVVKQGP
jgi:hypothetical protein